MSAYLLRERLCQTCLDCLAIPAGWRVVPFDPTRPTPAPQLLEQRTVTSREARIRQAYADTPQTVMATPFWRDVALALGWSIAATRQACLAFGLVAKCSSKAQRDAARRKTYKPVAPPRVEAVPADSASNGFQCPASTEARPVRVPLSGLPDPHPARGTVDGSNADRRAAAKARLTAAAALTAPGLQPMAFYRELALTLGCRADAVAVACRTHDVAPTPGVDPNPRVVHNGKPCVDGGLHDGTRGSAGCSRCRAVRVGVAS